MWKFNLISVLGTYVPYDYNTEFYKVVQNGVNVLDSVSYLGLVNFTDADCSGNNPYLMYIADQSIYSGSARPDDYCDVFGVVGYSKYLLNTPRYKYVPIASAQQDPCQMPDTVRSTGNGCFGRILRNGVYELGNFNAPSAITFTATSVPGSATVVVDDSGYEVLVCDSS